jgi:hypothetical protein
VGQYRVHAADRQYWCQQNTLQTNGVVEVALSIVTEHDGDGERVSLGLTLALDSLPSPLQLAGVTPLLGGSAGMLRDDVNGLQCSHLDSKLVHTHGSAFV